MFTQEIINYFTFKEEKKEYQDVDFSFDFDVDFYIQWIFDKDKILVKWELLSRLNLSQENLSIDVFFREIEKNNLEENFDEKILKNFLEKNKNFCDKNNKISINIFPQTFSSKKIVKFLENFEKKYPDFPKNTTLEILETDYNFSELKENLTILKQKWYKIAIDDLFSGNHNLDFISNINLDLVDIIKIDWKPLFDLFLKDRNNLENNLKNVIKALKNKKQDLKFVFEFIENEEYFEFAKSVWCDYFQGYFLEKPKKL